MDRGVLEELYERARAMSPAARAAFLAEACRSEPTVAAELRSLLAHAEPGEAFFAGLAGAVASPVAGHRLGQYRLLGTLGSGGMGTVYRAYDARLDREVALKFLPPHLGSQPEARERLLVEARAAAALEHPNVCTIHEIGETTDGRPFIAMACYAGETLKERLERGPVPPAEAVAIAAQIARGLAAAHARGIVHRDVKPGNVMLGADGTVRLLDFGLAKLQDVTLTGPGITPGTVAYMAPEQVRGDRLDPRTDLWALGVVLYEMLTGKRPFQGGNGQAVRLAILNEEAPPLGRDRTDIPERLARVIERLLRKDPAARYRDAAELLGDLEPAPPGARRPRSAARQRWRARATILGATLAFVIAAWSVGRQREGRLPEVRRLAVLPLADLTGDPAREYFVVGMHEALVAELSRVRELTVLSRQSTLRYHGSELPLPAIAGELGVDALLEGSVFLADDSVRITVQLVRADPEEHIWGGSYHRALRNALGLQGEVARAVAQAIHARAFPATPSVRPAMAIPPAAQEAYLKGIYHLERQTQFTELGAGRLAVLRSAVEALEEAARLAPGWASAHARLARAYHFVASGYPELADQFYPRSKLAAQRALELDENESVAHAALGFVLFMYEREWAGAEAAIRRALALDPNSHQWVYAIYLLATARYEEAIAHYRLAEERNPLSPFLKAQVADAYACAGRHDQAVAQLEDLAARLSEVPVWLLAKLGNEYLAASRFPEAIRQLERAVTLSDSQPEYVAHLAHGYARAGRRGEARRLLPRLETRAGEWYAPELYAALGDTGRAVAAVEAAFRDHSRRFLFTVFRCEPVYPAVRDDPRIRAIVRQLRFPA